MKHLTAVIALLALAAGATCVQAASAPLVSPEIRPDRSVVFRLNAPQANSVTLSGDFWTRQDRVESLTKGADGVWSLTTDPLTPDAYSYAFTLDGVPIPDPSNGFIKPGVRATQSQFIVPGSESEYVAERDVPHGEVRMIYYHSGVAGQTRRMHVYLPPGYEEGKTRYPVVYLFHGGGDDDWGWSSVGRVNFILDNLIAAGKAKPMIVVMPSLWVLRASPGGGTARADENEALFTRSLVEDIIPFADRHLRTLPGPANRAVGGLGAGRNMLPDVLWPTIQHFGYVVFVSGGAGKERFELLQGKYPGVIEDPKNSRRVRLFLGDGSNDASVNDSRFLAAQLKSRGYAVTPYETTGTHGWASFRRCFAEFAQMAFRP